MSRRHGRSTPKHRERARLRERLLAGAAAWGPWLQTLAPARLDGVLDCVTTEGQAVSMPFAPALLHVFNHGTHHRGQISAGLTMVGQRAPVMDLVFMLRQEAASPCVPCSTFARRRRRCRSQIAV